MKRSYCTKSKGRHLKLAEIAEQPGRAADACAFVLPILFAETASVQSALAVRLASEPAEDAGAAPVDGKFVDVVAIAKLLEVAPSKIATDERAGKIPSVRVGRYVRFEPAAVKAAYVAASRNRSE